MPLRICFASSEALPYSKTGGMADVVGSLSRALLGLGHDVALILPFHRETGLKKLKIKSTGVFLRIPVGDNIRTAEVLVAKENGLKVFFIKNDEYFDRPYLYTTPDGDYHDNLERFSFFSKAALEALKATKNPVDILHLNDWQTGLVAAHLKDSRSKEPFFQGTRTVFTVHNIAYQGLFPGPAFYLTGLSPRFFSQDGVEFWGKVSLLKAGLVYSDVINTVSPAYSREIQTEEYGCGLEGLLIKRGADLYGILNGIDYAEWNPETDRLLPARYSAKDLKGKAVCKKELLKKFGLKIPASAVVVGMVARLTEQKGIELLPGAFEYLKNMDAGFAILGSGDKRCEDLVKEIEKKFHAKVSVKIAFDNSLAHLVEAGSDIFIMPSRFEPCGLNQIYSLRYGTIPVVRAVGGLDDTIKDLDEAGEAATGFKFKEYAPDAFAGRLKDAIEVYHGKPKLWLSMQRNAMKEVFSWEASAGEYAGLYNIALKKPA